jgi:predicted nucleic acid-binding protein
MSVEPGVVDANILVYAVNPDVPQHAASYALLEAARDPAVTLYITSQILCEFYSIITNRKRVAVPISPADAMVIISDLLAQPGLHVLPSPEQASQVYSNFLSVALSPAATCLTCKSWPRCRPITFSGYILSMPLTFKDSRNWRLLPLAKGRLYGMTKIIQALGLTARSCRYRPFPPRHEPGPLRLAAVSG